MYIKYIYDLTYTYEIYISAYISVYIYVYLYLLHMYLLQIYLCICAYILYILSKWCPIFIKCVLFIKGLRDVTSTKYKSLYYTFQHFQELTKSVASALKFDKDLANADWNIVEKAIILQNPYAVSK